MTVPPGPVTTLFSKLEFGLFKLAGAPVKTGRSSAYGATGGMFGVGSKPVEGPGDLEADFSICFIITDAGCPGTI